MGLLEKRHGQSLGSDVVNRRQASLYLVDSPDIESMRSRFNPQQARLIPAHVTLCREDEVSDWDAFRTRLESLVPFELVLSFGAPVREGNFVYLPVVEGLDCFHELRCRLLTHEPRRHRPHVTIVNPRNGVCTDENFAEIARSIQPRQHTFKEVTLIEETDTGAWSLIARLGAS